MKRSRKDIYWVFMLDGDNTLWDTNAVFTRAQMMVLRELHKNFGCFTLKNGFKILRTVDDQLVSYYGRHEYDFRVLFVALLLHFKGSGEREAVREAVDLMKRGVPNELRATVDRCRRIFDVQMHSIPPLFQGVKSTLRFLRNRPSSLLLFSEGDRARIARIIGALTLREYFDRVYVEKKTDELYRRARRRTLTNLRPTREIKTMVVGDLLSRDIRIGNRIGAITVLRLGGYKPDQRPRSKSETPDYRIQEFPRLVQIVRQEEN